jgi:hypothetical protein
MSDQEEIKRQLIDYLVENDGEDSIEMLVEGILRITAADLNAAVEAAIRAATQPTAEETK